MRRLIALAAIAAAAALLGAAPALATTGKGELFLNGHVVGTTVTPAALPHGGIDPLYEVTNGVPGQLGIAAVGPGTGDYHGGGGAASPRAGNHGRASLPADLRRRRAIRGSGGQGDRDRGPGCRFPLPHHPVVAARTIAAQGGLNSPPAWHGPGLGSKPGSRAATWSRPPGHR